MQLHALQPELGDPIDVFDRAVALQRVDAAESNKGLGIHANRFGDQVVRHPRPAGGGLGIPGQEHGDDVHGVVFLGQLVQRLARDLGAEIGLRRLHIAPHRHVEPIGRG